MTEWKNRLNKSMDMWGQLHGVPLLPLANGKAGHLGTSLASRGAQRFIVATRRQQGLIKPLSGRFVHLKAIRRLAKFFECDEFLKVGKRTILVYTCSSKMQSYPSFRTKFQLHTKHNISPAVSCYKYAKRDEILNLSPVNTFLSYVTT